MNIFPVLIAVLVISAFGWLGGWVAKQHGRDESEGRLLGAFLGPMGVLIEALLPAKG